MTTEWYKAESFESPKPIDTTISKKTVFVRKNIVKKTRHDEMRGDDVVYYSYDEMKVPKDEWDKYRDTIIADMEMTEAQQLLTEMDIAQIETEQSITDLDIRVMMLEG